MRLILALDCQGCLPPAGRFFSRDFAQSHGGIGGGAELQVEDDCFEYTCRLVDGHAEDGVFVHQGEGLVGVCVVADAP